MPHPKEILKSLDAAPLKSLSQNFLTSPHWAKTLVNALTDKSEADAYWEIGPGLGALTQVLLSQISEPVTLFEYDRKISAYLRKHFPNSTLLEGDILDAGFDSLPGQRIHILSNLPYHLSSPILFKVSEIRSRVRRLVFTFQKEFAQRVKAHVGDELYGALSIISQLQYSITSLGILPASAFYPEPNVNSEALLLVPTNRSEQEIKTVTPVIKAAFLHPRKKMVKNLKGVFPKIDWFEKIERIGKSENVRAEELTLNEFVNLCSP